jgi:uncharacterized protein YndB with AHSA1/START domain
MGKIFTVLVLLVAALAVYVAMQPSEFTISRSRTLAAPPAVVFAYLNDFHQWKEWSPWEKLDPAMRRQYSGAPAGPGAIYEWAGNDKVGDGRMTIVDSKEPETVSIRLEFLKPYQATNTAEFFITPGGLGTDVTWAMSGHNGFMAKAASLVLNIDKQVGGDFEKGLAALDQVTEAAAKAAALAPPPAIPEEPEAPAAGAPAADAPAAEAPAAPAQP